MAYFDWGDEELFDEAIETIDPLKITVRWNPVIVVGPVEVRQMSMENFARVVREDDGRFCAVDARSDLQEKCAEIEKEIGESAGYFVLGLARLDLADEPTYRALLAALEDRSERFTQWMPHIEF
jgi:hypothetical protein